MQLPVDQRRRGSQVESGRYCQGFPSALRRPADFIVMQIDLDISVARRNGKWELCIWELRSRRQLRLVDKMLLDRPAMYQLIEPEVAHDMSSITATSRVSACIYNVSTQVKFINDVCSRMRGVILHGEGPTSTLL